MTLLGASLLGVGCCDSRSMLSALSLCSAGGRSAGEQMGHRSGLRHLTRWWIKYLHGLHQGKLHSAPPGSFPQQSRMCSMRYLTDLHTSLCCREAWWPGQLLAWAMSTRSLAAWAVGSRDASSPRGTSSSSSAPDPEADPCSSPSPSCPTPPCPPSDSWGPAAPPLSCPPGVLDPASSAIAINEGPDKSSPAPPPPSPELASPLKLPAA
mmetsp:Transcript_44430/g.100455  ORF Transcript_44430/g.100455 Transcript_44430/m.100455 type:complete len:209 (+) Transcript_44430:447-1073(+)